MNLLRTGSEQPPDVNRKEAQGILNSDSRPVPLQPLPWIWFHIKGARGTQVGAADLGVKGEDGAGVCDKLM